MKTFVVPDMHSHYETLKALLKEAGVIDFQGRRVDREVFVVSLGDLANCVADNVHGDIQCLRTVGDWIDLMLMGNHEHPYFGGPAFGGFWRYPEVEVELRRIEAGGWLKPTHLVNDILISHAGYVPTEGVESAQDGSDFAIQALASDEGWRHQLFTQIPTSRGGWHPSGGILWSDWSERKAHEFNQIVGHTPQNKDDPPRRDYETGHWSICIDMGVKSGRGATGVWVDEDGELEFVSVDFDSNNYF